MTRRLRHQLVASSGSTVSQVIRCHPPLPAGRPAPGRSAHFPVPQTGGAEKPTGDSLRLLAGIYLSFDRIEDARAAATELAGRKDVKDARVTPLAPDEEGALVEVFSADVLIEATIDQLLDALQIVAHRHGGDLAAHESDDY